jgi:hypothetical protein
MRLNTGEGNLIGYFILMWLGGDEELCKRINVRHDELIKKLGMQHPYN